MVVPKERRRTHPGDLVSINVKPTRWMSTKDIGETDRLGNSGELVPLIWGGDGSCMIECTAYDPDSMQGRKVYVYLDAKDVTEILLSLRDVAITARSKPMTNRSPG